MGTPEPDALATLGMEVVRLTRATQTLKAQLTANDATGLEWAAYALLGELVNEGAKRTTALAAATCVNPSTISRQVHSLVALQLVERQPDPVDGRAALLAATDHGRAVYADMIERRRRAFAVMLADWSHDDVRTLQKLLARLNDSFTTDRSHLLKALAGADVRQEPA